MFQGQTEVMTQRFVARMSAAFHAANLSPQGRIKLLPNVDHLDYLRINHHCDIMLDTLHWSGGNTSLDAIASGLPIVTLPGTFMRGRQSAAMLQWLGCGDEVATSASDYVARAVQLLTDIALREAYRDKLRAGQKRLFNDRAPVSAFVAAVARLVEGQGPA
jgi:CRISPR-associated protein Csy1